MGNTCVGPRITKNGFFQSVSATLWRARSPEDEPPSIEDKAPGNAPENKPPEPVKIPEADPEPFKQPEPPKEEATTVPPRKPLQVMNRVSSAGGGKQPNLVLKHKTEKLKDLYSIGKKLGAGQFGTTYLCVEKATGKEYACKSILKRKLTTEDDVEDVRREIQIMHHLSGHPNVISIKGAYEDAVAVHVVMELCAGGELFDRIIRKGHYTERKAAELTRLILGVLEACHSLGVMHRDLKPENFLFVNQMEEAALKTIDFGLSVFFKPGEIFSDVVGSPYYVAPEVLKKRYGPEADVWSAGVIIYILLSGVPPFWAGASFSDLLVMQFSWAPLLRDVSRLEISGAEKANRISILVKFVLDEMGIPVINLEELNGKRRNETMSQLHEACANWGFFWVENHGISKVLMEKVTELVNQHYEESLKERFYESELARGLGSQPHSEISDLDWESSFFIRHHPNPNYDDIVNHDKKLGEAMKEYVEQLIRLAETLAEAMSENLGLEKKYIKKAFSEPSVGTKVAVYPQCSNPELVIGLRAHTDAGGIILERKTLMKDVERISSRFCASNLIKFLSLFCMIYRLLLVCYCILFWYILVMLMFSRFVKVTIVAYF